MNLKFSYLKAPHGGSMFLNTRVASSKTVHGMEV
jgi:hypothetical protein